MRPKLFIRTVALCGVLFLTVPTILVISSSFSAAETITFPPRGATFHWYKDLVTDDAIYGPIVRSLIVGVECVLAGLLLGVPAALGVHRFSARGRSIMSGFLALGFTTPVIVSALALLLFLTKIHISTHLLAIGLCVAIVNLPFMIWTVSSALVAHNPELEEAAATLGAEEVQCFLFVTLPSIASGIISGVFLMFVFGITDFLMSFLLTDVSNATLPVYMFSSLRQTLSPVLAVVGALYIAIAAVMCVFAVRIGNIEKFLYRS
jgi:putative spermidine/putrescine transport system permease protein